MAYKTAVSIQDMSCYGKCSLTVSLPILSAMGISVAPLPTGILSSHTGGFGEPARLSADGFLQNTLLHWQSNKIMFDGAVTGYFTNPAQIDAVTEALPLIVKSGGFVLADPVMGDDGRFFSGIDGSFAEKMLRLCSAANLSVPNFTEACLLTGTEYETENREEKAFDIAEKLYSLTKTDCVITGVDCKNGKTACIICQNGNTSAVTAEKIPGKFHGTGDMFASLTAGYILNGEKLGTAVKKAMDFIGLCIKNTVNLGTPERDGICFETELRKMKD